MSIFLTIDLNLVIAIENFFLRSDALDNSVHLYLGCIFSYQGSQENYRGNHPPIPSYPRVRYITGLGLV